MADYISREKEFRKLNEKLNDDIKKSTNLSTNGKINDTLNTRQNPLTNICYDTYRLKNMGNERFATYTKEKRSTLNSLRKIGGGDSNAMSLSKSPTSPKTTKLNYGNTFHQRSKTLPKGVCESFEHKNLKYTNEAQTSTKSTGCMGSSRKPVPKETLVIYKNEKFSNSASLDDMLTKSLEQTIGNEDQSSTKTITPEPNAKTTASTQAIEQIRFCGGKSSQKFVNTGSLIRFLKSKVTLLEENQARSTEEMTKQKEIYEDIIERHKAVQQQLEKALNRNDNLTEQLEKMNIQLTESNRRNREQSQECLALKKELETVKREFKHLTLNYTNLEKRYTRTKEETENAQKSCLTMRQSERDLKEHFRRETEAKDAEMKYLKKQRSDLFNAYKKQLFLIDNLRQQNVCLEQAKMIDFCEKEFGKILEWNIKP